jgi:hypothetical protein
MSSFHKNHGPMISGGSGSAFQLTITNPTGMPSATTARYHGLARGYSAASASRCPELGLALVHGEGARKATNGDDRLSAGCGHTPGSAWFS